MFDHHTHYQDYVARSLLREILKNQGAIMASQQEIADALNGVKSQLAKAAAEIVSKIADLEAAVAAGGNSTQEVDDAVAGLKVAAQGLDDVVPDAV